MMDSGIRKTSLFSAVASVFLTTATPAFAADGFVSMSFDKAEYLVGEPVTMKVSGTGTCKNIEIQWGDGQASNIPSHIFSDRNNSPKGNLEAKHAYAQAQVFNATVKTAPAATSGGQCGSRTGSVKVSKATATPAVPAISGRVKPGEAQGFNPQPDIPGISGRVKPGEAQGFNPQPDIPGSVATDKKIGNPDFKPPQDKLPQQSK
jgi:hypothetical protein